MSSLSKIRVGVLRGGKSPEYKVSLETGRNVLENLPEEFYTPVDILISKDGAWHVSGLEKKPQQILKSVDVVWNALHGEYGEDGTVQKILELYGTPYTGSSAMPSSMGMNKIFSKRTYADYNLKTPFHISIPRGDLSLEAIHRAYKEVPSPFIVKPSSAGSSLGVYLAQSLPELEEAVIASSEFSPAVIVEEFIDGREATCGVIDNFRGSNHYSLMPVEIRHKGDFFDYNAKYLNPETEEISPGNFSKFENNEIRNMAILAHMGLGLRHYSRSDFIVHPKRGVFILETDNLPDLLDRSSIIKSLRSVGSSISEFLHHVLSLALGKNR